MSNVADRLMRSLRGAADTDNFVDCNVQLLVMWTGLSRASIYRALEQLARDKRIEVTAKSGRGGGLRIRLTKRSQRSHEKVSKPSQNGHVHNAYTQVPPPSGAGDLLRDNPPETVSAERAVTVQRSLLWHQTINDAVRQKLRHSPDCYDRKQATKGCPYCEYVYQQMGRQMP